MLTVTSGVFPVYNNVFKIGTAGRNSAASDMKTIADMTSFSVSINGNVEEWTPMTTEGWVRRLMTGKGFSITLSGKRHVGDDGNDYLAGLKFVTGQDANSKFEWVIPDGTTISFDCVVNITTDGGESTDVNALEVEILSDGKPTVTNGGVSSLLQD